MDTIYTNIKKRREELGMSQRELARRCGYKDNTTLVKIEQGVVDISISRLYKIAKALNTTPIALTGWLDNDKGEE